MSSKSNEIKVLITEGSEAAKESDSNAIDTKEYDAVIEVGKGQSEESIDKNVWKQMENAFTDHISVEHFGCAVNGIDEGSHYVSDAPLKLTLGECTKETTTAALSASQFCACNGVQMKTEFLERDRELAKSEEHKSQEAPKKAEPGRINVAALLKAEREKRDNRDSQAPAPKMEKSYSR